MECSCLRNTFLAVSIAEINVHCFVMKIIDTGCILDTHDAKMLYV